jgi:magnesium transporter
LREWRGSDSRLALEGGSRIAWFRRRSGAFLIEKGGTALKYRISGELEPLTDADLPLKSGAYIDVLTNEEIRNRDLSKVPHVETLQHNLSPIRFCKAEMFEDCIIGTLKIPIKPNVTSRFISLTYLLQPHRLVFVTKDTNLDEVIGSIRQMKVIKTDTVGSFFIEFLMHAMYDDVDYLTSLEDCLISLEESIFSSKGKITDNMKAFQTVRRDALRMSTYYQQLEDMFEVMRENENGMFSDEECSRFQLLGERCARLYDLTATIREYGLQLHELQQAEIQNRQNSNMATLTVITAIFLPLTLLVGWYGMNFAYMPELNFRYGYLIIFLVSIIIIVLEILFFKKKHFID